MPQCVEGVVQQGRRREITSCGWAFDVYVSRSYKLKQLQLQL